MYNESNETFWTIFPLALKTKKESRVIEIHEKLLESQAITIAAESSQIKSR